ncbi:DUF5362 domain-containing protein [Mucilaginibacter sp. 14171R-50]|uniref:DUF5362 family protein n=1 Tax=Mucilaginibacter sp. 14171R-50 TaxID=2703789 RepID=UPI00138CFEDB|nr:DUF5362 family protein [Mucilaginibacter sp. 14171R-50]QHS57736.1 DUF5362 domain-containing protein [Mucilaginibacter sp. 14171R-50]
MEIDETPMQPAAPEPESKLILTDEAQYYLQKAGQWAYFLGIMGFIGTAFVAIMALFVGALFSTMASMNPMMAGAAGMGGVVTFFYLLIAVFTFFFALYLYQFGDRVKKAVAFQNTQEMTLALSKLKSFFKFWGIFTIVILALDILIFVIFIIAGVGAATMAR